MFSFWMKISLVVISLLGYSDVLFEYLSFFHLSDPINFGAVSARLCGYKTLLMSSSAEREICPAYKFQIINKSKFFLA